MAKILQIMLETEAKHSLDCLKGKLPFHLNPGKLEKEQLGEAGKFVS